MLEGRGRAAERAQDVVRALGEIGARETTRPYGSTLWWTSVRFQLLTVALAQDRGIDRTRSAGTRPRWDAARKSTAETSLREQPEAA